MTAAVPVASFLIVAGTLCRAAAAQNNDNVGVRIAGYVLTLSGS
jgi:hypothetical protein